MTDPFTHHQTNDYNRFSKNNIKKKSTAKQRMN